MKNYFQNITKKQSLYQLMIPPYKQTLLRNTYMDMDIDGQYSPFMEQKHFTFFLGMNMLLTNRDFTIEK